MNFRKIASIAFCIFCLANSALLFGQVKLPRLVSDSMIVQRDAKIKVWGWASKGEKISVSFNGKNAKATAGADGKWMTWLSPTKAGGPYTMTIKGSNTITLNGVLVGDVWFCSGQSNMVHLMEHHKETYAEEIANANNQSIRHFLIPTTANLKTTAEDFSTGKWKWANPKDINRFSAVAYFFAKKIYEKYHVPIGLINASAGGTPIEAWISEGGLKDFASMLNTVQKNKDSAYVNSTNRAAAASSRAWSQRKPDDKGLTGTIPWYDTTYVPKNWHTITVPGYWEGQVMRDFDGVVWYRKEVNLPASMKGVPAKLTLGRIVDADFAYINGVLVGSTSYQYPQRRYQVPKGLLKAGKNILVVRVINNSGKGGFVPDKPYFLTVGTQVVELKGDWQYKVGEAYSGNSFGGGITAQNQPTALYNTMVAPAVNFTIKGILWYQGESNTSRAQEYSTLLPALMADWRNVWKQADAPFLYVQLPNFMEANYLPAESQWAELREAQFKSLSNANSGMAVAIDLGEWNDIHPDNKKDVGERLALVAQHVAYGDKAVVYSGPIYESSKVEGNKIIVNFSNIGGGLISIDDEPLSHFAIAGADKKFVWAKATIENNTVIVTSDKVSDPLYVRYAWADNPDGANLYNKEKLPASPFRTDQ